MRKTIVKKLRKGALDRAEARRRRRDYTRLNKRERAEMLAQLE